MGSEPLSRIDRNPCPRPTPPSLWKLVNRFPVLSVGRASNVPSSFSSFFSSAAPASPPAAAAPPAAGAAAAPPPEPTFRSRSLTSLPSSAYRVPIASESSSLLVIGMRCAVHTFANSDVHIGSTSWTPAALMRVLSLSACFEHISNLSKSHNLTLAFAH